jgi:hypothetical protein
MRRESLLTAMPKSPVQNLPELYAIAFDVAQQAIRRYVALAGRIDEAFWPIRCVFEVLTTRERHRADRLSADCVAVCGKHPDISDLRWAPIDLVPAAELADVSDSRLSTPYTAWALAVRHRQRAFVFWTYIIALAEDPLVRRIAEDLAHEALSDGSLLRRERRRAWRAERRDVATTDAGTDGPVSAALLESLLLKDMIAWSQGLTPAQRQQLLALDPARLPPHFLTPTGGDAAGLGFAEIEAIKRRALRRAEQLSNIYLNDADSADDQSSMDLAQKLAAQSIMRLASLRHLASEPGLR